ncbi:MAG: UbiX family flavin prenyltransferase [Anaerolineae bacterium]|nr:UbiX family flavin prenyltransferase [Thermoflexus sp.]MDW8064630.1 UbiX family flavin prenyltransferase [Anaerolineae bacterium]
MKQRLVVGISGASGVIYGIRLLEVLRSDPEIETHLILSPAARITIAQETDYTIRQVMELADVVYAHHDIGAAISSGSFRTIGMVVIPCSIKTLGAIVSGYTADLISRAADVTLKEGRPLVLVVRETPLHIGHLDLMRRAARMGAIIMPPVPAFYGRPRTIQDLIDQTVGRVLLRLGIENDLYARWKEK